MICEEAGEVLESHIVTSLSPGTQQLILIGDHQQLRPKLSEYTLSIDSGHHHNLDLSLFERLVLKYRQEGSSTLITLDTQRRMRPVIADLLRFTLYPKLRDAGCVFDYPPVRGFSKNLHFFSHSNHENTDTGEQSVSTNSFKNTFEAKMIVELVRYLVKQGYKPNQIAVLTPYVGQLLLLRNMLGSAMMAVTLDERDIVALESTTGGEDESIDEVTVEVRSLNRCIRLATVDNFQGEEAEVVIISTVRNNTKGRTGFLKISNRVNVMISRAKHGMFILGSKETIKVLLRV